MVNSSCSKVRYCFGCTVVRIFRADMLECCQQRHLPFARLPNFKAARSEMAALSPQRTGHSPGVPSHCEWVCSRIATSSSVSRQKHHPSSTRIRCRFDWANSFTCYGSRSNFTGSCIVLEPFCEVSIFFLGHACLDNAASVGRIVSLSYGYQLLSLTAVLWAIF